ncbi:MAG TPA: AAA family ATPase [Stellaceae bacterium]|jgi:pilus assembly protein CpaE|nr:AAA family ATPase [Stellaceae bacterium]
MMGEAAKAEPIAGSRQRFVACVADDVTREAVSRAVAQLGWSSAKVRAGGLEVARKSIDITTPPTLVLVDLSDATEPVEGMHELAQLCGPSTHFLAIGSVNDVALYRHLIALGVADYLVKPVSSELLCEAFAAAIRSYAAPGESRQTRLFAFIGARGGVGTTTVAVSTAWLLAHEFKLRSALIDLDLHFGNLALSLDLEPGRGLREALENPERTDSMLLASAMVTEGEKLPILATEESLEEQLSFDGAAVAPLLAALSQDYDCLVVDLPRSLDAMARQVIALADATIVVTDLSLAALRDSVRLGDLAKTLEARGKPLLVANQVGADHRGEIGRAEFERGIGGELDHVVPFDVKAVVAAAHNGKALPDAAANSKAAIELRKLAARLAGREAEKPRSGLLGRFKK